MKCEEFRTQIVSDNANMSVLESHLERCPDCATWLEKELSTPPEGLTSAEWVSATSRCMPEIKQVPGESHQEEKVPEPVSAGFFTGIKYGLVFGLSVITGLAILQIHQESKRPRPQDKIEIQSFLDNDSGKIPSFVEKDFSHVTFLEFRDSKILSFVEVEKIPSFIEEPQEEDSWIENESG